jgi:hypothetical protein
VYQVFASDDPAPANWVTLGSIESTNGLWRLVDSEATNYPQRFHHARPLP